MYEIKDWSVYDSKIDLNELRALAGASTTSEFKKMDCGEYSIEISSLSLVKSKSGAPMVKGCFKIVNGPHVGDCIYMHQIVQHRFQIDICNSFLRSLKSDVDVYFSNYDEYGEIVKSVWQNVNDRFVYRLSYGRNAKGFDTFSILNVSDSSF